MLLIYKTPFFIEITDSHSHILNEKKFPEPDSGQTFFSWILPFWPPWKVWRDLASKSILGILSTSFLEKLK